MEGMRDDVEEGENFLLFHPLIFAAGLIIKTIHGDLRRSRSCKHLSVLHFIELMSEFYFIYE